MRKIQPHIGKKNMAIALSLNIVVKKWYTKVWWVLLTYLFSSDHTLGHTLNCTPTEITILV